MNPNVNGTATSKYTWKFNGTTLKSYPTGAGGVAVTANAAAWTLGAAAAIVAASTITSDFQIVSVVLEAVTGGAIYQLTLYDDGVACLDKRFTVLGAPGNQILYTLDVSTDKILANSAITAKLQTSSSNADDCTISIEYQEL